MLVATIRSNNPELDGHEVIIRDYHQHQVLVSLVECPRLAFYWDRAQLALEESPRMPQFSPRIPQDRF